MMITKVIVPRRYWTRITDMVDDLHRNYSSAAYVFRNSYFFTDLPAASDETSNVTYLRHRQKVYITLHGGPKLRPFSLLTS